MSFRPEDKEKEREKSGLGTGLAVAAAIGVGVGAALYYFINKRTENPTAAGSTAQGWTCESPHNLLVREETMCISDDSYTTLSEHSTTDTSIFEDSFKYKRDMSMNNDDSDIETIDSDNSISSESQNSCNQSSTDISTSTSEDSVCTDSDECENDMFTSFSSSNELNDSELSEWDLTTSLDYPSYEQPISRNYLENYIRDLIMSQRRDMSRERSWSLEECSICFDVILRDQEIMSLPCTHNFHTKCILPWLQEQQTCPNCRKSID